MRALDRGDVTSARGAAVLVPDYTRTFDPKQNSTAGMRGYNAGTVQTKTFYSDRKTAATTYNTRDFYGTKLASAADRKFATKEGPTRGQYEIPNAMKAADTKTLAVNDAREAGQSAATREMPNAHRPYLGKESEKLHTALDPNNQPRYTNDLRELKTIDDVRDLLNKNK